jgi:hypothetical protein
LREQGQGVNVMNTIFGDFHQISGEKNGVFLDNLCYDHDFRRFSPNLWRKNCVFLDNIH